MRLTRRALTLAMLAALPLASGQALAQGAWPEKAIRFITPYPPGGSSDVITRFAAERLSKAIGQPVVVENRPGAGASVGTDLAARAAPDGYTFLVAPTAAVAVAPLLMKTGYTADSFVAVAKLSSSYGMITARKDSPFNNYKDFVAAARNAPGKYTFASNGVGSIVHLTGVMLHKQSGLNVVHVPYKGATESITDLLGGRIDVMYDPATAPRIKQGQLKGLATVSSERNPMLPDIPTLKEQGFDFSAPSWFGLFAPKGTPAAIVNRVADIMQKSLEAPGVREQLLNMAMYPDFEGPAAFGKTLQTDAAALRDLVQKENIKAE